KRSGILRFGQGRSAFDRCTISVGGHGRGRLDWDRRRHVELARGPGSTVTRGTGSRTASSGATRSATATSRTAASRAERSGADSTLAVPLLTHGTTWIDSGAGARLICGLVVATRENFSLPTRCFQNPFQE